MLLLVLLLLRTETVCRPDLVLCDKAADQPVRRAIRGRFRQKIFEKFHYNFVSPHQVN
jgi:hypothetical protein